MNAAHHPSAVLQDKKTLYPAIFQLDNQAINDLFTLLDEAASVCRNMVYVRTHWLEEAQP